MYLVDMVSDQDHRHRRRSHETLHRRASHEHLATQPHDLYPGEPPNTPAKSHIIEDRLDRADLERSKELLSHAIPGATWGEIVARLAKEFVKRNDPLQKPAKPTKDAPTQRNPAAGLRRVILQKAQARCEYVDPQTKRQCESRHQLEIDHVRPYAMGGPTTPENLRALCRVHHQRQAEKAFGLRGEKFAELHRNCGLIE